MNVLDETRVTPLYDPRITYSTVTPVVGNLGSEPYRADARGVQSFHLLSPFVVSNF